MVNEPTTMLRSVASQEKFQSINERRIVRFSFTEMREGHTLGRKGNRRNRNEEYNYVKYYPKLLMVNYICKKNVSNYGHPRQFFFWRIPNPLWINNLNGLVQFGFDLVWGSTIRFGLGLYQLNGFQFKWFNSLGLTLDYYFNF